MEIGLWILLIILIAAFLIMVKLQYNYIGQIEKKQKDLNISQYKMYEKMSFQEEQLHYSLQSKFFTGTVAHLLYKFLHRKK